MKGIAEIGFSQLLAAYVFLILLLVMASRQGIDKEKEIIVSALRMTFQLVLMGYVLVYILEFNSLLLSACTLFLMELYAVKNIYSRVKVEINPRLRRVIVFSMFTGTVTPLLYFLLAVINISPWYEARYFIPIAGMFIGNSMTGVSLGVKTLSESITIQKDIVEAALMLGARPKDAVRMFSDRAFDSAILPTLNSMIGMGIVFLPGMMTGQILSGASPITAIKYQIAIMLGILGGVTISVSVFLYLGYKAFFNREDQLIV